MATAAIMAVITARLLAAGEIAPDAAAAEPVAPVTVLAPLSEQADEPPACDVPDRPPDPRCGDSLDGRAPPAPSTGRKAARALLAPPRAVAGVVFWPLVKGTSAAERYDVMPWLTAITTTDDGKVGVRPEVQYASGFAPSVGARFFYRRLPGAGSELDARFKAGGAHVWHGALGLAGPDWLGLSVGALWDRRSDRLFAGIGTPAPGAPAPVSARYRGDIYRLEARWRALRAGPMLLTLAAGGEGRTYAADDLRGGPSIADAFGAAPEVCAARGLPAPCVDLARVPGFEGSRQKLYERARLALDLRPSTRDASGVELGVEGTFTQGIAGHPGHHARLGFDATGAIGGIDRVLLLRLAGAAVEPIGSAPVPFDDLVSPTGVLWMRGLPEGLLRDRSGAVATLEYRWLISSALDASLFVDEGATAGAWFAGLAPGDFRTSVGLGLRMHRPGPRDWEDRLEQGVQVAYSRGYGVRILLSAAKF